MRSMKSDILEEYLAQLKLPAVRESYFRIASANPEKISYLRELLEIEISRRQENGVKERLASARFPAIKTFDTFEFTSQPNLPKIKLLEHGEKRFIDDARNVVLYGPPGTGKTHCLIAIGVSACLNGVRTRFTTAAGLLGMLLDAKRDGLLTKKLRSLDRYSLLLIDELGYIPFEREATDLLFQVISERYESKSIALTTNLAFEQWTQIFPDAMAARAVIDRLIHHGSVFEFAGQSHRLKTRGGKLMQAAKR
jgi:DNA replication protein DnaC